MMIMMIKKSHFSQKYMFEDIDDNLSFMMMVRRRMRKKENCLF